MLDINRIYHEVLRHFKPIPKNFRIAYGTDHVVLLKQSYKWGGDWKYDCRAEYPYMMGAEKITEEIRAIFDKEAE